MRLVRIDSFDDDTMPTAATFTLTRDELLVLYRYTGHVAPTDIAAASGDVRWANASDQVATAVGGFFNTFWDSGVDDVGPRFSAESIVAAKRNRESNNG